MIGFGDKRVVPVESRVLNYMIARQAGKHGNLVPASLECSPQLIIEMGCGTDFGREKSAYQQDFHKKLTPIKLKRAHLNPAKYPPRAILCFGLPRFAMQQRL
jgi:hypothetical protein